MAIVEGFQGGAVADADHRGAGQALPDQPVKLGLGFGIAGGGGLVQEQPVGTEQQGAGHGQTLLFSGRQALRPMVDLVEMPGQSPKAAGGEGLRDRSGIELIGRGRERHRGMQAADYPYALAWAKSYGKGRVFYATFAHAPSTWDNPKIQEMYLQALKWALGEVDADITPLKMPPATPDALPPPAAAAPAAQ